MGRIAFVTILLWSIVVMGYSPTFAQEKPSVPFPSTLPPPKTSMSIRVREIASMSDGELTLPTAMADTSDALRGLAGVYVYSSIKNGGKDRGDFLGLNKDQLNTTIELKLRESGIKILTEAQRNAQSSVPTLYVSVEGSKLAGSTKVFQAFIRVGLVETVEFHRPNGVLRIKGVPVWTRASYGTAIDKSFLLNTLREKLGAFSKDYLVANPDHNKIAPNAIRPIETEYPPRGVVNLDPDLGQSELDLPGKVNNQVAAKPVSRGSFDLTDNLRSMPFKGSVTFRVFVDANGSHTEEVTDSSGNASIDQAALAYIKRWRWKAAMQDGKTIRSVTTVKLPIEIK